MASTGSRADPQRSATSLATTLLALARTSRPLGWVAALALYRIGMAYGSVDDTPVTLGLSVTLTFPFCLYLFGLNDLADKDSDLDNPRKGNWIHGASAPVQHRTLSRWSPWLGGAAVALFVPMLPPAAGAVLAGILAVSWAYSARPFRLKEIPIIDGLVTATIMIGLLCTGFLSGGSTSPIPVEAFAVAPTLAAVRTGPRLASAVALALSLASTATIAWLDYAEPIAIYLVIQPTVIAASMLLHRWLSARRAIAIVGLSGLLTLTYLALVYVRDW
jgi:hypothetical protein